MSLTWGEVFRVHTYNEFGYVCHSLTCNFCTFSSCGKVKHLRQHALNHDAVKAAKVGMQSFAAYKLNYIYFRRVANHVYVTAQQPAERLLGSLTPFLEANEQNRGVCVCRSPPIAADHEMLLKDGVSITRSHTPLIRCPGCHSLHTSPHALKVHYSAEHKKVLDVRHKERPIPAGDEVYNFVVSEYVHPIVYFTFYSALYSSSFLSFYLHFFFLFSLPLPIFSSS